MPPRAPLCHFPELSGHREKYCLCSHVDDDVGFIVHESSMRAKVRDSSSTGTKGGSMSKTYNLSTKPKGGGKTRAGGRHPCGRIAGHGTNHLGMERCKHHGGATLIKHGFYSNAR